MTWTQSILLLVYVTLFVGSIAAMLWWHRRQRKMRLPFGEELKLLRAPGETQLALVRKFDEDAVALMMLAAAAPATVGLLLLMSTAKLPQALQLAGIAVTLVTFIAVFIWAARWYSAKARESGNRYLGYFGERLVAECLEPLKAEGWRVFHDVPGASNGKAFNIDHVVVGPTGVFVVETKTRRKGGARPGFDDHKVYFDGRSLIWPWGEDNHGLEQAERNAGWLATMLQNELGDRVVVTPYLTLPGWWVDMKPSQQSRQCQVTNPKLLARLLPQSPVVFTGQQIAAIAGKLEARCRDVAY
jgi:nuclease-like protein